MYAHLLKTVDEVSSHHVVHGEFDAETASVLESKDPGHDLCIEDMGVSSTLHKLYGCELFVSRVWLHKRMRRSDHQTETSTSAASCRLLFDCTTSFKIFDVAPRGIIREHVHANTAQN